MKLPVQKTEKQKETMMPTTENWPPARSLMEKFFPEEWVRPLFDREFFRDMDFWMPKVDISETDDEFRIKADVPGVKPEDVKVELSGDDLIIHGQSEEEKEEEGKAWHRVERKSGMFHREFELPKGADPDKIDASISNGTLMVNIKKKPEAQKKNIEVKEGKASQGQQTQEQERQGEEKGGGAQTQMQQGGKGAESQEENR